MTLPIQSQIPQEPTLLDYWQVIYRRKIMIILLVMIAGISSVIIAFQQPKIYSATVTIMPPQNESTEMSLAAKLGGLSGLGLGNMLGGSPSDLWVGILKSHRIADPVIEKFNLVSVYEIKYKEDVYTALLGRVKINFSPKDKIISLTVEDENPQQAAEMANFFVEELDRLTRKISVNSAGRTKLFLEERLIKSRKDLAQAEEDLKTFQQINKAIKLDTQSTMIISVIGNLKGELIAKEIELKTILTFTSSQQPQVEKLKTHIRELERKIKELEQGSLSVSNTGESTESNIMIPSSKIPELALDYARLLRQIKIQETVHELLTQQYEMAKIQEAKDNPIVQILDKALVPERPIKPKKRQMVMVSVVTALFASIFLTFFLEYLEGIKKNENTPT